MSSAFFWYLSWVRGVRVAPARAVTDTQTHTQTKTHTEYCNLAPAWVRLIKAPLAKLDRLNRQLIQRAKCYQTVRLGTYTHKVPAYNSLKACKGTMFVLPLPFNNTVETVDEVIASKVVSEPELYIIINGKPTKNNVLWRELVDIEDLKAAI